MKKVPAVFLRRFDSHKFEKIMRRGALSAFFVTKNNIKNIHKVMFENINQSNNERD